MNTRANLDYSLLNFETRNIKWIKDIYREQILVGDELTFSENQIKEHFLKIVFVIKDPIGQIVFEGFKTNPRLKCQATGFKDSACSLLPSQ